MEKATSERFPRVKVGSKHFTPSGVVWSYSRCAERSGALSLWWSFRAFFFVHWVQVNEFPLLLSYPQIK